MKPYAAITLTTTLLLSAVAPVAAQSVTIQHANSDAAQPEVTYGQNTLKKVSTNQVSATVTQTYAGEPLSVGDEEYAVYQSQYIVNCQKKTAKQSNIQATTYKDRKSGELKSITAPYQKHDEQIIERLCKDRK
jgi:Tfp pilus assembly protein PilX